MSDDPATLKDIAQAAIAQHGWIIGAITTTWAVVLRALIGLHLADRKQLRTRLTSIEQLLVRQDQRLNTIEDRSRLRRREDRRECLEEEEEDRDGD